MSGTCTLCQDPSDDGNCTSAYGNTNNPYICDTAGSCVPGNCHSDANCTAGEICGVTTANTCGTCTADTQCQTDPNYGSGTICNTANGQGTSGQCVSATCANPDHACTANPSDFCCASGGIADTCTPGDCCVSADCAGNATGSVCVNNQCAPCTLDSQCANGQVCNTSTGICVTNSATLCTASTTAGKPGTCTNIGTDVCCPTADLCFTPPSGATTCCPGVSGNSYCQTALGNSSATCTLENTCTTCDPVSTTNPVYYVDPVNGSDGATGSARGQDAGASESCALKTISRALKLISVVGTALPTQIVVVGASGGVTVSAGETFPLVIPSNVTVTTSTGPVKVQVPSGKAGFEIASLSSSITGGTGAALTITTTAADPATVFLPARLYIPLISKPASSIATTIR